MKSQTLRQLKEDLKGLAERIRGKRREFRLSQRTQSLYCLKKDGQVWKGAEWRQILSNVAETDRELAWYRELFRHQHIAYCMVRGKTIEQIEGVRKPCPAFEKRGRCYCCNRPDMERVAALVQDLKAKLSTETSENPKFQEALHDHA